MKSIYFIIYFDQINSSIFNKITGSLKSFDQILIKFRDPIGFSLYTIIYPLGPVVLLIFVNDESNPPTLPKIV
jgi:hypothetical protein